MLPFQILINVKSPPIKIEFNPFSKSIIEKHSYHLFDGCDCQLLCFIPIDFREFLEFQHCTNHQFVLTVKFIHLILYIFITVLLYLIKGF